MSDSIFYARLSEAAGFVQQDLLERAGPMLRELLADYPDDPYVLQICGILSMKLNRHAEAEDFFRRAIAAKADYVEAYNNLGIALRAQRRFSESIEACAMALRLRPDDPDILHNLGGVYRDAGEGPKAVEAIRRALAARDTNEEFWNTLGLALLAQSDAAGAVEAFKRAEKILKFPGFHTNRLFAIHFDPQADPESIFAQHLDWDRQFAQALRPAILKYPNDRNPSRRLRIGYVSGDFRRHSAAFFIEPLLVHHDPEKTEIFLYGNSNKWDDITDRIRSYGHHWRDIFGIEDDATYKIVRDDQIDILVDLSGHTEGARLLVFARKPAPVQVAYLGYPDTTGLSAIDYRLTDPFLDPPGLIDRLYTEKLIRLPHTFACYRPPEDAPPVSDSPALTNGFVTFASFNSLAKVNPQTLDCWAEILRQVPTSRFLMATHGLESAETRQRIESIFQSHGIAPSRLELLPRHSWPNYLALHHRADILLDTFPVGGHTVACHAIWMGVPVITLTGKTTSQRLAASVLSNLNLQNLIADTPRQFFQTAVDLAADIPRLADLRGHLREKFRQSPVVDGAQFAREVESAYRQMWKEYLSQAQ
ncbi:MAG: tetratricopeptide repeat protein [Tepidisphaeraceae bacterium]|jgi:predicted O-linked N-acetylglucosamine transferase (SPINDLY family)